MAGRVHGMDQILEGRYPRPRKSDAPTSKFFERADSLGERCQVPVCQVPVPVFQVGSATAKPRPEHVL